MARMIPIVTDDDSFNDSIGEMRAYDALKSLPDDYIVFHSVSWNRRHHNGRVVWGESDFVVIAPNKGVLVIEVKDGDISLRDGMWYQKNRRTGKERVLKKSPMTQAQLGKYAFLELMSDSEKEYVRNITIEPIVWFTSLNDLGSLKKMPPDFSEKNVFTAKSFDCINESIEGAFEFYGMKKDLDYDKTELDELISIFSPSLDIVQNYFEMAEEQDYVFHRLTTEQAYLLDYLEEQHVAAIQGSGGTGKTMLALEKARRLSENDEVLFLCFNSMLLNYLRSHCHEKMPNVSFFNLYGLCKKYTMREEISEREILDYLNEYDKYNWRFKHIIVDEGQDFSSDQLDILNAIADMNGGCFYVFFDKNQLVQRFDDNSWFNKVDCRLVLTRNCRNTVSIAKTSYKTIGIDDVKMGININGEKPRMIMARKTDRMSDLVARLIRNYTNEGFRKNRIVILTLKTEQNSCLSGMDYIGGYKLTDRIDGRNVLFTTARKYKGLESDVVILVDFDKDSFTTEESRKLFYVASSRAKHFLDIVSVLDDSDLNNLVYMLGGEKRKNPRLAFASLLKVKMFDANIIGE